jgi:hypothetical protein
LWYFDELCNNQAVASFEVKSRTFSFSKKNGSMLVNCRVRLCRNTLEPVVPFSSSSNVIGEMVTSLGFCQQAHSPTKEVSEAVGLGTDLSIDAHHENVDAVLNVIGQLLQVPHPDLVKFHNQISWTLGQHTWPPQAPWIRPCSFLLDWSMVATWASRCIGILVSVLLVAYADACSALTADTSYL